MTVQTAVHALTAGLREALTIWIAMIAFAAAACVFVSAPSWRERRQAWRDRRRARAQRRLRTTPASRRHRPNWTQMNDDTLVLDVSRERAADGTGGAVAELRRYAEEVAVAADRAAEAAERWRSEWLAVQKAKDSAWQAYEQAETAARRAHRAAAFPLPDSPLTTDERSARERYLHRAAREAYRRGELTPEELRDVLSHRNGWDPLRHPFEQQLLLRRAALERKLRAYHAVSTMERRAWETVEVADAARSSLRREAYQAEVRARQAYRSTKMPAAQPYVPVNPTRIASLATR
ncbi:MAG TPA: hypothetical protein VJT31_27075 [Rugosimonospora sp.]|nr:hypothetical protein [Rugosimonospora sp.]